MGHTQGRAGRKIPYCRCGVARVHVTKAQRAGKTSAGNTTPTRGRVLGNRGEENAGPARTRRRERRRAGVEKKRRQRQAPPKDLPQHSHCLGRHLRITLVVPCVKYRLWSVAVTICYERTRTHTASDPFTHGTTSVMRRCRPRQ